MALVVQSSVVWLDWLMSTHFVCSEESRDVAKNELAFEDLEKITPDDAARIVEWLTEKIDALGTRLKPEPKEQEEVGWLTCVASI